MKYNSTRGRRNNNPLNIRFNKANKWLGETWPDYDGFCRFKSMKYGIRAAFALLRSYNRVHNLYTVAEIINRWAPPKENHTDIYIAWIVANTCLTSDEKIKWNEDNAIILIQAMCQYESKLLIPYQDLVDARKLL